MRCLEHEQSSCYSGGALELGGGSIHSGIKEEEEEEDEQRWGRGILEEIRRGREGHDGRCGVVDG